MEGKLELFILILVIVVMIASCGGDREEGRTKPVQEPGKPRVITFSQHPGVQATYEARPGQMRALEAMRKATICNIVGKKIVEAAIGCDMVKENAVIYLGDVPHAQIVIL